MQTMISTTASKGIERAEETCLSYRGRAAIAVAMMLLLTIISNSADYLYNHMRNLDNAIPGVRLGKDGSTALLEEADVVPSSSRDFVSELGQSVCRFPLFFDESGTPYKLNQRGENSRYAYVHPTHWREDQKLEHGEEDADDVIETIEFAEHVRGVADWRSGGTLPKIKRNLTFVHVGKAGGSSVNCQLRSVRGWTSSHCDNESDDIKLKRNESAISRHVNCYTHWDSGLLCFYLPGDYLINLRSPMDRIASWFTYEHTENHDSVYPLRDYHCGQLVLNSCYRNFDHLTAVGLSGPRPEKNRPLKVGTNLTSEECSQWAWATVQGTIPADYHNAYNYDWYAHRMLFDSQSSKSYIFALRMEHLEYDWTIIDQMLGGDGAVPAALTSRQNSGSLKPYRVSNHNTTRLGMENLCRALCEEIQVYKQLLTNSVNLRTPELQVSLEELRKQCPEEVDLKPRPCL